MIVEELDGYELGFCSRWGPRNNPNWSWRNNLVCYSEKTKLFYVALCSKILIFERCNGDLVQQSLEIDNTDPNFDMTMSHPIFDGPGANYLTIATCGSIEYLISLTGTGRVILRPTGNVTGSPLIFNVRHSAWSVAMAKEGPYLAIGHNGAQVTVLDISLPPGVAEIEARKLSCCGNIPCVAFSRDSKRLMAAILPSQRGTPGLAQTELGETLINTSCPQDAYGNNWACLFLYGDDFMKNEWQPDCHALLHVPEFEDAPNYEFCFWAAEKDIYFGRFDLEWHNFSGGEWWTETFASVDWSDANRNIYARLNLVKHIKHLGVLVVANQFGAIRIIELCHREKRDNEADKDSIYGFRLVAVLSVRKGQGHRGEAVTDTSKIIPGQVKKDAQAWVLQGGISEARETNDQVLFGLDVVPNEADESAELVVFTHSSEILSWTIRRQPIQASRIVLHRSLGR
ncbi:hypothetical protein BCR37DRAFT_377205 [Protomyces lactucae-debilis]|uniref:Uncharacterized protein n=1 Tax=Protomyces lactucae-debilis TaxID=2754530 RepID=A0A1Y2FNG0_PROLT|nr:uncharacterized protein BCR37DRAFT_377205 [Protomyces lactucae-debilis]ORY85531.1 hypothetical protein BCR37DRAFT_377205 [Protomyces lactucae-debilis]